MTRTLDLDLPIPAHWPRWAPLREDEPDSDAESEGEDVARFTRIPDTARADSASPDAASSLPGAEPAEQQPARSAAMLIVSPLLPLPASLPRLLEEALASEPDFRIDWRWPLTTPRAGPWELCVLLVVGTSRQTGIATGRVYAALDAGFGAFLIVLIDREARRLAERQRELCTLLASATLGGIGPMTDAETGSGIEGDTARSGRAPIPPQRPPAELFLSQVLYRHFVD